MLATVPMNSSEKQTSPERQVAGFRIIGKSGYVLFRDRQLHDRPITIGRSDECNIQLADLTVSRHHCEIETTVDGRWIIRDCGSVNGIRVSEIGYDKGYRRVRWTVLQPGRFVRLGAVILVIVNEAGRCPVAGVSPREFLRIVRMVYHTERAVEEYMGITRRQQSRLTRIAPRKKGR